MQKLLIITTNEDRSEHLFVHEKLQIDIAHYHSELLSRTDELAEYDYVYFRDPFNTELYDLDEIGAIMKSVCTNNPDAYYFDSTETLEDALLEDKWRQAELFSSLMPHTELVEDFSKIDFERQFVKKRISSRARGVIFGNDTIDKSAKPNDYIVQEKLDIIEEYRVIALQGILLEDAVVKSSKTDTRKVKITGIIPLTDEIRVVAAETVAKVPSLDFVGLDIAKISDGTHKLIEINRSPQFVSFTKFTGKNPFEILVKEIIN